MAKAIFVCKYENGSPVLPDWRELNYDFVKGVPQKGGWSLIGLPEKGQAIIMVEAPDATIELMRKDTANYQEVTKDTEDAICSTQKIDVEKFQELIATPWAADLVQAESADIAGAK